MVSTFLSILWEMFYETMGFKRKCYENASTMMHMHLSIVTYII